VILRKKILPQFYLQTSIDAAQKPLNINAFINITQQAPPGLEIITSDTTP
jgi:hypothetical protein